MNKNVGWVSDSVTRQEVESVVPGAMSGYATLTRPTRLCRIKFITASLDQGNSPIAANIPAESDELGVLKLSAVSKGRFNKEENKALRTADESEQLLSLRKGDVLITRGNTPELVADVAYVPKDEPNLLLPDLNL